MSLLLAPGRQELNGGPGPGHVVPAEGVPLVEGLIQAPPPRKSSGFSHKQGILALSLTPAVCTQPVLPTVSVVCAGCTPRV